MRRERRIGEKGVQLRNDRCSFPDRAAHALDRTQPHVSDSEDTGHARL